MIPSNEASNPNQITTGVTQFRDLTGNEAESSVPQAPRESPSLPVVPPLIDREDVASQDQPDQEPGAITRDVTPEASTQNEQGTDGTNVPLPEEDDDELLCEAMMADLQELEAMPSLELPPEHAWKCEILVTERDIQQWKKEGDPSAMCFIATAAKKQRSEVKMSTLTTQEKVEFQKAKEKEVNSWLSTGTVERIVGHRIPRENVMRCRWILTWKSVDGEKDKMGNPLKTPKARLVLLGFEDPLVDQLPRDAPTMHKLTRMLLLQMASNEHCMESPELRHPNSLSKRLC